MNPTPFASGARRLRHMPIQDFVAAAGEILQPPDDSPSRQRVFTPRRTFWLFLAQVLSATRTCREAVRGGRRFTLTLKDVVCSEGIAVKHAMDAARAMGELKSILAATQYRVWKESPPDMRHDCDLANQVWNVDATLTLGVPLEEREFTGRSRKLENETRQPVDPGLFRVPEGMTEINAPS